MVSHSKNPPKIGILKISWNWLITLMPAAVWQILNMKHMQWPKTCWNLPEKKSWNHIKWTYFWLNSKSEPKNWLKKNSWNWRIILMPATILNMKGVQKPEMEIKWICWNLFWEKREITSGTLTYFWRFLAILNMWAAALRRNREDPPIRQGKGTDYPHLRP